MLRSTRATVLGLCFGFAGCTTAPVPTSTLIAQLHDAPAGAMARLWLANGRIIGTAVPVGPGSMPAAVRTTFEAVLPGGAQTFAGRESGPRGTGFRIDKNYTEPEHQRSALVADDGAVLERAHTVTIAEVPPNALATALRTGPSIEEAWIVSGPAREEFWQFAVRDRSGRAFVVKVGLDGTALGTARRTAARIDAAN